MGSRSSLARLALVASTLICGCATIDEEPLPLGPNSAPQASLRAPVIAPVGRPIALDAGASTDPDGEQLTFIFEFNDGTPPLASAEPMVQHSFPNAGLYTARVRVIDLAGAEGVATQDITARDDYPDPPDFCEKPTDCVIGDECDTGVCYATGGSID